jgi:hypothetical protein
MVYVAVGTESYGRVRVVGDTAVVTQFQMLMHFPLVPIRSYYVWGPLDSEETGVPFLYSVRNIRQRGVPLTHIDFLSVVLAYTRAVLAVMILFGFIVTFTSAVASRNGRPMNDFAATATRIAQLGLVIGCVAGIASLVVPTAGRREKSIRSYCGEILEANVDPARVPPGVAKMIQEAVRQSYMPHFEGEARSRRQYIQDLTLARCDVALSRNDEAERLTDDVLQQLAKFEAAPSALLSTDNTPDAGDKASDES